MSEPIKVGEMAWRIIAEVDWTDECEVVLQVRGRTERLTPDQARQIAAALTRSAEEADRAAASVVRPGTPASFDMDGHWRKGGLFENTVRHIESAAIDLGATIIRAEHLSPDCQAGKHPAGWIDSAWDDATDVEVPCECACHSGETAS